MANETWEEIMADIARCAARSDFYLRRIGHNLQTAQEHLGTIQHQLWRMATGDEQELVTTPTDEAVAAPPESRKEVA